MYIYVRCLRGFEFRLKIRLIEVHALLRQTVRSESARIRSIVLKSSLMGPFSCTVYQPYITLIFIFRIDGLTRLLRYDFRSGKEVELPFSRLSILLASKMGFFNLFSSTCPMISPAV